MHLEQVGYPLQIPFFDGDNNHVIEPITPLREATSVGYLYSNKSDPPVLQGTNAAVANSPLRKSYSSNLHTTRTLMQLTNFILLPALVLTSSSVVRDQSLQPPASTRVNSVEKEPSTDSTAENTHQSATHLVTFSNAAIKRNTCTVAELRTANSSNQVPRRPAKASNLPQDTTVNRTQVHSPNLVQPRRKQKNRERNQIQHWNPNHQ